jgi:tRNA nucleotidyltransferase/poly(A) polymerase
MRAVRFVSQLDFYLDQETLEAVKLAAPKLTSVSWERIHDEMAKLLRGERPDRGVALMEETGLLGLVLPEVKPQNINHTIFKKSGKNELLGWVTLFKETSKKDRTYAYSRLKFSGEKKKTIESALENLAALSRFSELTLAERKRLAASPAAILAEDYAAIDQNLARATLEFLATHRELPAPWVEAADLLALGLKPGKGLGDTLAKLFDAQLNEEVKTKSELLERLK